MSVQHRAWRTFVLAAIAAASTLAAAPGPALATNRPVFSETCENSASTPLPERDETSCETKPIACPPPPFGYVTNCKFESEMVVSAYDTWGEAHGHATGETTLRVAFTPTGSDERNAPCFLLPDHDAGICDGTTQLDVVVGPGAARGAVGRDTCDWQRADLLRPNFGYVLCRIRLTVDFVPLPQAHPTFALAFTPAVSPSGDPVSITMTLSDGRKTTGEAAVDLFSDSSCTKPLLGFRIKLTGIDNERFNLGSLTLKRSGSFYADVRYPGDSKNIAYAGPCQFAFEHT